MAQTSKAKAQTMRAVALDKFGGPEALKIQNIPVPQIDDDEVLIRVEAAGVGAWDPFEREGGFVEIMGIKPKFPYVLGHRSRRRGALLLLPSRSVEREVRAPDPRRHDFQHRGSGAR